MLDLGLLWLMLWLESGLGIVLGAGLRISFDITMVSHVVRIAGLIIDSGIRPRPLSLRTSNLSGMQGYTLCLKKCLAFSLL